MFGIEKAAALQTSLAGGIEELGGMGDRAVFALKNTLLGLLIVFAVLLLLTIVVRGVSLIMGGGMAKRDRKPYPQESPAAKVMSQRVKMTYIEEEQTDADEGEILAAISAAVAVVLESEGKDPHGFRVVSFKRSNKR